MRNYKFKKRLTISTLLILITPSPIIGLLLFYFSKLLNGLMFYLLLPLIIIISLMVYLMLVILIGVINYRLGYQVSEGLFSIKSREFYAWLKSIQLSSFINALNKLGVPRSGLRMIYEHAFPTRLGKSLVLEGVVEYSLVNLGDNCIIGHDSAVWGHLIEGDEVFIKKVSIGDNVTIGAKSIVMPGAVIGDNTIVGAMSLVPKNKVLKPNSLYVGVPVRLVKSIKP